MATCLIGLGSNRGDRPGLLQQAIEQLARHEQIEIEAVSSWHGSRPLGGPPGQSDFLNGAARLRTSLSPEALLLEMAEVEQRLGRERQTRWGPRTIDLDLLLYEQQVRQHPDLILPHPRMQVRPFVLAPAAEIAAELVHPQLGWTVGQLWQHVQQVFPYLAVISPVPRPDLLEPIARSGQALVVADPPVPPTTDDNSTVPDYGQQIQLLRRRQEALAGHLPEQAGPRAASKGADAVRPIISEFWIEQSAVLARMTLSPRQAERVVRQMEAAQQNLAAVKLLIRLAPPPEAELSTFQKEYFTALGDYAHARRIAPVLSISDRDPATMLDELLAAVQGMVPA